MKPEELLTTHCLPTTAHHARISRSPQVQLGHVCPTSVIRMAGNAMNCPSVGIMMYAAILGLS